MSTCTKKAHEYQADERLLMLPKRLAPTSPLLVDHLGGISNTDGRLVVPIIRDMRNIVHVKAFRAIDMIFVAEGEDFAGLHVAVDAFIITQRSRKETVYLLSILEKHVTVVRG